MDISYVHWTFQMSIGHFKCPLDPMDHWTLYSFSISTMPFPGGYKVRYSPLDPIDTRISNAHSICPIYVHWTFELCALDPMDSHMSNGHFICPLVHWIQWTVICPMDISYVHWTFALVLDMYELSCHSGNDGLVVRRIY
jgi:hypothetical protein